MGFFQKLSRNREVAFILTRAVLYTVDIYKFINNDKFLKF